MNVTDVANRVRRTFGDESSIQITDQDIIRWVNDAQERLVMENEGLMQATGVASTVANQKEYTLPADMYSLHSLAFKGFHLQGLNFNEFNKFVNGYKAPSDVNPYGPGTPEVYMIWNNTIWLHPVPDTSETDSITIYYTKHPTSVGTLADGLSLPLKYHNAVVNYVLAQAYEMDENLEAKSTKIAEFTEEASKLNEQNHWTNKEVYPSITVLPEDENYGHYGYLGGYFG